MTTEQLNEIITGYKIRCKDPACRKTQPAEKVRFGYCFSCWDTYRSQVESEKDELQAKLESIATHLRETLRENNPLTRAVNSILDGPKVFTRGVIAHEVNPGAVARVLAFAYEYATQSRNAAMTSDVLLLKSRI